LIDGVLRGVGRRLRREEHRSVVDQDVDRAGDGGQCADSVAGAEIGGSEPRLAAVVENALDDLYAAFGVAPADDALRAFGREGTCDGNPRSRPSSQ
jgi:hypothetical protein